MGNSCCKQEDFQTRLKNRRKAQRLKQIKMRENAGTNKAGVAEIDHYVRECMRSAISEGSSPSKFPDNDSPALKDLISPYYFIDENYEIIGNRIKSPTLLYHFDKLNSRFFWSDSIQRRWRQNSLSKARVESSFKPGSILRSDLFRSLYEFSTIAMSNRKIHLIGKCHLEYDLVKNIFRIKPPPLQVCTNPVLIYGVDCIYSISGEVNGQPSKKCQKFDILKHMWVQLPDIDFPHASGNGLCVVKPKTENESGPNYILVVLGGYTSKSPMKHNPNISIFDPSSEKWSFIRLETLRNPTPIFLYPGIVQDSLGKVYFIGSEQTNECFEWDITASKLRKAGRIPQKNKDEYRIMQSCIINEKDEIEILFLNNHCEAVVFKSANFMHEWCTERPHPSVLSIEGERRPAMVTSVYKIDDKSFEANSPNKINSFSKSFGGRSPNKPKTLSLMID